MFYPQWTSGRYLNFMVKQPLVDENSFRTAGIAVEPVPIFDQVRAKLPAPYWEGHDEAIDCWWKVWELAFQNLNPATPENGFIRNYIDTAFNGNLFLWDSVFILLFVRYGLHAFDFQATLDNFYARQHTDGFICRELRPEPGGDMFHPHDPASTGPNVLAWGEWHYYRNTGDRDRIARVFPGLLAYHRWLRKYRTWPDGSYWANGLARGMDNQPWGDEPHVAQTDHGHLSRVDVTAQAILSAQCLLAMARLLGREAELTPEIEEIEQLKALVNTHAWDPATQFYYDWHAVRGRISVKSIGVYWLLLADAVPADRLGPFVEQLNDPATFNRPHRVPCMAKDGPDYQARGGYWRGGVWPPTNYMLLQGLTRHGYADLAYDIARNHHDSVVQVFRDTGTVWEFYAPELDAPGERHDGKHARPDMVGWGGLAPVAGLLEYRFGLQPDVPQNRLIWDVREMAAFGVERYPFGADGLLDLTCAARSTPQEKPAVTIRSNWAFTLELRWAGGQEIIQISPE